MTSLIAGFLLAIIYGGLMYVGAKSGSVYAGKEIGRTALLSGIATLTLGNYGKVVLGLLVASACLTTSVGLAATAGNFFEKHIKNLSNGYRIHFFEKDDNIYQQLIDELFRKEGIKA